MVALVLPLPGSKNGKVKAVETTAYAMSDYRTTPDLATRLIVAAGTEPPTAPSLRGLLARILARK